MRSLLLHIVLPVRLGSLAHQGFFAFALKLARMAVYHGFVPELNRVFITRDVEYYLSSGHKPQTMGRAPV
jgi:hypothetical protein